MLRNQRVGSFLLATLLCAAAASAQQNSAPTEAGKGRIHLDVVVTRKSGPPVSELRPQDFTLLDNQVPQTIRSFKAVTGREAPLKVLLVIDAVNAGYEEVAYERNQIRKFLREDQGHLAYPTALTMSSDQGVRLVGNFSTDGNALSALVGRGNAGLPAVRRNAGFYGAAERLQLSLRALRQLLLGLAKLPGRKVVLWVSPGWPFLSGVHTWLTSKQQRQVFADVVKFSTQLRQARVTLYSIDPRSPAQAFAYDSYYKGFIKGVSKPNQALPGDLGLEVLAVQSGGLALVGDNVTGLLRQCLADTVPYYEISFAAPAAQRADEYHHLQIKLATRGLIARTRQGYYAQP
jgi:VWFA-related protein